MLLVGIWPRNCWKSSLWSITETVPLETAKQLCYRHTTGYSVISGGLEARTWEKNKQACPLVTVGVLRCWDSILLWCLPAVWNWKCKGRCSGLGSYQYLTNPPCFIFLTYKIRITVLLQDDYKGKMEPLLLIPEPHILVITDDLYRGDL